MSCGNFAKFRFWYVTDCISFARISFLRFCVLGRFSSNWKTARRMGWRTDDNETVARTGINTLHAAIAWSGRALCAAPAGVTASFGRGWGIAEDAGKGNSRFPAGMTTRKAKARSLR